jgi:hypothetical protein
VQHRVARGAQRRRERVGRPGGADVGVRPRAANRDPCTHMRCQTASPPCLLPATPPLLTVAASAATPVQLGVEGRRLDQVLVAYQPAALIPAEPSKHSEQAQWALLQTEGGVWLASVGWWIQQRPQLGRGPRANRHDPRQPLVGWGGRPCGARREHCERTTSPCLWWRPRAAPARSRPRRLPARTTRPARGSPRAQWAARRQTRPTPRPPCGTIQQRAWTVIGWGRRD